MAGDTLFSGLQSGKSKRDHDQDCRCNDPSGTEPDGYVGNDGSSWHEVSGGQCRRFGGNEWDLGVGSIGEAGSVGGTE